MKFDEIVEICKKLEATRSKKEKVSILEKFLVKISNEEIKAALGFLLGEMPKINVGYATISKFMAIKAFKSFSTELKELYEKILNIGKIEGRTKKEMMLSSLLSSLNNEERKYLLKALIGEMRHGVNEGLLIESVSKAYGIKKDKIKRAFIFSSLPEIIKYARMNKINEIKLQLYKPIKLMKADISSFDEIAGKELALEFKFDGIRIQVHKGKEVKIFSRNFKDLTNFLPEVVEEIKKIDGKFILDGEIIAYSDKPLPFQNLIKKFRMKNKINVPIKFFAFDILYLNGEVLIDNKYKERWEILKEKFKDFLPIHIVTKSKEEMIKFFERAIKEGHEGIVAKDLHSLYRLRKGWYKIKKSYSLDLVIIAAEWGHGRRHRWLSDFWLAALDNGKFHMVGKTFKGLSDEEFEELTQMLLKNKIKEKGRVIFVKPIVVEVEFDGIQKSRKYGYALRFARIKRIRWDKDVKEANEIKDVKRIYEMQQSI